MDNTIILFSFFIYALRTFTALFWGILLFFYGKRSRQNLPLSIIFIVIGILYFRNCFARFPEIDAVDVYNPLSYLILIFIAPFTIFYAYFSIGEKHGIKHYMTHFIPFVCMACLWLVLTVSNVPHIPFCYSLTELIGYTVDYPLYAGFFILLMIIFIAQVITYFSMALVRFIRVWKNYRSYNISVRPLRMLIVMDFLFLMYPMICIIFMSYNNILNFGIVFNIFVVVVITALSVLNINLILPIKTDLSFMNYSGQYDTQAKRMGKVDEGWINDDLSERIKNMFEQKEIYRLSHLRLQDLADELGTNRSYVSACINNNYGCNFNQFLINYRVNAAKDLLQNSSMTIQEIIDHVGFNTRTSFYRAFKERIDSTLSPAEWRKRYGYDMKD